jgi:hypothetical protein
VSALYCYIWAILNLKSTPKMTPKMTPNSTPKLTPNSTPKLTPNSTPKRLCNNYIINYYAISCNILMCALDQN